MNDEPNPSCACGCGLEVTRPTYKFILGHSSKRKLSGEAIQAAKQAIRRGVTHKRIAEDLGVSTGTIVNIRYGMLDHRIGEGGLRYVSPCARTKIIRRAELESSRRDLQERKAIRRAKKQLQELKEQVRAQIKRALDAYNKERAD